MNNIANNIQAILFAVAETKTIASLASLLNVSKDEINTALHTLTQSLEGTALMLVKNGEELTLVTRPEHSTLLETLRKEELSKELSKASAETLSIICYHPGATRAEIEFIRGVNATYSIRALLMRGLVELRAAGRVSGYYPTTTLLEHYGIANIEALPKYKETADKITALLLGNEAVLLV